MNPFVILTDSGCDIIPDILAQWGVSHIPLTFRFEGEDKEYTDEAMPVKDFYDRMRQGMVAKTAAINVQRFADFFETHLKTGNDVLYLGFSSGLSGTYHAAHAAAEQLRAAYPEHKMYLMRFVEDYMDYYEDYLESIGAIDWE